MSKSPVKITRELTAPEKAGKYHRVICMTGKNKGLCYYINSNRIVMGRSTTAEIQVLDTQASREHVEITRVGEDMILTDLGSQNGVVVNDLKVKQHKLKSLDKIIIGSTVFKYSFVDIMPLVVVDEDETEEEEVEEEQIKKKKKKSKNKPKNKIVLYAVVLGGAALILLPSDGDKPAKIQKTTEENISFIEGSSGQGIKKTVVEKEVEQKVDAYIHRGRREAREGNYFRAMEEFSLALMLDPNSGDAAFHMNRAKQRLDEKIEEMFNHAIKYKDSLKYNQALMTYCSIMKLLKDYPEDTRYTDAKKNTMDMARRLDKEESEDYCI